MISTSMLLSFRYSIILLRIDDGLLETAKKLNISNMEALAVDVYPDASTGSGAKSLDRNGLSV